MCALTFHKIECRRTIGTYRLLRNATSVLDSIHWLYITRWPATALQLHYIKGIALTIVAFTTKCVALRPCFLAKRPLQAKCQWEHWQHIEILHNICLIRLHSCSCKFKQHPHSILDLCGKDLVRSAAPDIAFVPIVWFQATPYPRWIPSQGDTFLVVFWFWVAQ